MTVASAAARQVGVQIGYARVSTADQHPGQQVDALRRAGCSQVFVEIASGNGMARQQLKRMLTKLQPGDDLRMMGRAA